MIATSHVIIGGAVGLATNNPALGFFAGIVSHIVCDAIPHLDAPFKLEYADGQYDKVIWSRKLLTWAIVDSLFAFSLTLFLWIYLFDFSFASAFAWGAFGSYLPDLLDNFPLWSQQIRTVPGFKQFHKLHLAVHNIWRFKFLMPEHWLLGSITQIIFILPSLWFITR